MIDKLKLATTKDEKRKLLEELIDSFVDGDTNIDDFCNTYEEIMKYVRTREDLMEILRELDNELED